nr:prominin-like protein isoform X1 [Leptinotarsa decemlineata]
MSRRRSKAASTAAPEQRLSVNALCFLFTCVVLLVAVNASDGGFWNSIDKITKNLEVAFGDLDNKLPNYTDYKDNEVYLSTKEPFNSRGMAGLYNLTMKFMDWIINPDDLLMKDLVLLDAKNNIILNDDISIGQVLKHYWGLLLIVLLLILITILVPFFGLFFCCCRCCGNCGARSQPCDKKRDLCKKVCQGSLLIILGTALLFCVVCAFASNQQLQNGIEGFSENARNVKKDSVSYLESIKTQATNLCVQNYQEFSKLFKATIQQAGFHVMQQLTIWSNATAMMHLNTFVATIPNISRDLNILKEDTNSLRASASQLNDAMRKVKRDLLGTLEKCKLSDCSEIKNNISHLQTNIDFNKLPDVSPTIDKLNEFNTDELRRAAEEGKQKLDGIEEKIKAEMNGTLDQAIAKVDQAGETIKTYLNNITEAVSSIQTQINYADDHIDDMKKYIHDYGHYRYYGSLVISCILLLIAICIAFGLICGICGKRPDGYSDNCCNKGAGSQFLICAVMIMFISTLLIGVITLVMLLSGLVSDRAVCYPMRNPEKSKVLDLLDELIDKQITNQDLHINVKDTLQRCYRNESIYKVFNLQSKFDIDTITNKFDISQYLDQMNSKLTDILKNDFTILSERNENILKNLSNFDPSINFDQFQHELNENFTNLSLNEISSTLRKLAERTEGDVKQELLLSILHINTYDEKLLTPMKEKASQVIVIAQNLDSALKMNSSNFSEAINNLITEIEKAQETLRNDGTKLLKEAAKQISKIIKDQVDSYLNRVTNVTRDELGQCGPLNVAIQATLISTCDKILLPWNGFWVTLLFTLLLFIPTIIVSVKLATLYQKYKQNGQYVETEYLYDAYADRGDNIPLNSRGAKQRGAKKKKKVKKHEERPQNMGGEVVSREYAAGSHPPESRYADMAPKHWEEFPNGGPPQYQRAPTEYERPPPYYYPGTGEQ